MSKLEKAHFAVVTVSADKEALTVGAPWVWKSIIRCKRGKSDSFLRLERGSVRLTDGFARVELGSAVSRYMSLILSSQRVQLVFNDVLTLRRAEEAVSVPWRDTDRQTHRDTHDKGHSRAAAARRRPSQLP